MSEGFALHEIICDEAGVPADYLFLEINSAFERLTGLKRGDVVGRRVREVIPEIEYEWIERYGRVALTGEPDRFENLSAALGRWYQVFAYRPAEGQFAVIFSDVTERKMAEERAKDIAKFPLENPLPVLRVSSDGVIVFANPASDILLRKWHKSVRDSVPEEWRKTVSAAWDGMKREVIEEVIDESFFSFHIVPVQASDYMNVYGTDITYLKKSQEELNSHKKNLEKLVSERTKELGRAFEELSGKQRRLAEAQRIGRMGNWDWNVETNELSWSDEIYRIFEMDPEKKKVSYESFLETHSVLFQSPVSKGCTDELERNNTVRVRRQFVGRHAPGNG